MNGHRPSNWDDGTPDEELVGWAQSGQHDAFGVLYDRYVAKMYGYCFRMLREHEAACDANSVVFTKALTALPKFRAGSDPGSFRRWLFTIAHNVILDELRSRRATESLAEAGWIVDPARSPEESAIDADERRTVLALLSRLSVDQRHVISLRLAGLSAVEIANVLGRPRNAIDGIQHRALLRLKEMAVLHSARGPAPGGNDRG